MTNKKRTGSRQMHGGSMGEVVSIQDPPIRPEDLIQNILQLMNQQITKLLQQTDDLTDAQVRLLPELMRVLLAANKKEQEEEEAIKGNLSNLPTAELEKMLKK